MKNTILILILLIIGTGCNEDNLDLYPSQETELSFFQTEEGYQQATMGVYQKLRIMYAHQRINMMSIWLLPDDNLTTLGEQAAETFSSMSTDNGNVRDLYQNLYEIVARANVILYHFNNDEDVFESEERRNNILGETLFLRAYAYFFLWNFWGGAAPLVLERPTSFSETQPPSSGENALLDQAIVDFKEAANLLPVSWDTNYKGRATKNSAYGYLGKALVTRGTVTNNPADFSEALNALNQISGVSLTPLYQDNFSVYKENNEESLLDRKSVV